MHKTSCAPPRFPWNRCLRVHENTQTIIWNLIPLMMCSVPLKRSIIMQASLCFQQNTRWSHSSKPSLCSFVLYSSSAWLSPLFISAFVKRHLWMGRCTRCRRGAAADEISAAYSLSKLGVHLILTEHFKQTGSRSKDSRLRPKLFFDQTFTKVCRNSAAN